MGNNTNSLTMIADRLTNAARIAITTHARPDGDAIGSVLGLKRLLDQSGRKTWAVEIGPVADRYAFLVAPGDLSPVQDVPVGEVDLFVVLDCITTCPTPASAHSITSTRRRRRRVNWYIGWLKRPACP